MQFSFSIAFDFSFERVVVREQVCSKSSLFFFVLPGQITQRFSGGTVSQEVDGSTPQNVAAF